MPGILLDPAALCGGGLAALAAWALARRVRGRIAVAALAAFYFAFATPLGANLMLHPFEASAPGAACGDAFDGAPIVVLAGGIDAGAASRHELDRLHGATLKRVLAGIRLAHARPGSMLVMSGGTGGAVREADLMAELASSMGIDASMLRVERISGNTYESAVQVARMLAAAGAPARVRLVTSALHMERARAAFEARGVAVCARPVDFRWIAPRLPDALLPQASALAKSADVLHEAGGLLYYRLAGRLAPPGGAAASTR